MSEVFISYARADRKRVEKLASALAAKGYSVWWDRQLVGGSDFSADIEDQLHTAKAVIVAWSGSASKSTWVRDEAAIAADTAKLVSVSLDGADPPIGYRQYHCIDLDGWHGASDERLAEVCRAVDSRLTGEQPRAVISKRPHRMRPRVTAFAAISAVVLAFVSAAYVIYSRSTQVESDVPIVAVLPFVDLSGAGDGFADGLGEELINALARTEGIDVIARSSSFRFRNHEESLPEIAAKLDATHVFEGSVRRAQGRLRVSARLVDGSNGIELWADQFDRQFDKIFEIQSEISASVAQAAGRQLAAIHSEELPTEDVQAYELYVRAHGLWAQRGEFPLRRAITLLESAISRDPDFAEAWALLGNAWLTLPTYATQIGPEEAPRLNAAAAAERALALDPMLAEPYAVLAWLAQGEQRLMDAEALFQNAIERAPSSLTAVYWYGEFLREVGRFNAAQRQFERAYRLDPLSPVLVADIGMLHTGGDLDAAEEFLNRAWYELGFRTPLVWEGIWVVHNSRNDIEGARNWLEELPVPESRPIFELFLRGREDSEYADEAAKKIFRVAQDEGFPVWTAYMMLHWLSAVEQALDLARGFPRFPEPTVLFLPQTSAARDKPAFWLILKRHGFANYWLKTDSWPDFCRGTQPYDCRQLLAAAGE